MGGERLHDFDANFQKPENLTNRVWMIYSKPDSDDADLVGNFRVEEQEVIGAGELEALNLLSRLGQEDQESRGSFNNKKNGWESFSQEQDPENQKFFNAYNGVFAQRMELARPKVEGLLKVVAIDGKVILTSMAASRKRSIDANPDGSVTAKRRLSWGEKPQDEDLSKPYLVSSIPAGWRIDIDDQKILQELMENKSRKPLEQRYARRLNSILGLALRNIIVREKLTSEKDRAFKEKLFLSIFYPGVMISLALIDGYDRTDPVLIVGVTLFWYGLINNKGKRSNGYASGTSYAYEYLMPPVEIDRVARGRAYLNLKGRNLVRLAKDK